MRKPHLTTEQVDQVLIRITKGDRFSDIGQEFGVVGTSISRIAKKYGIERQRAKETKPRDRESQYLYPILQLHAEKYSLRKIGKEFGLTHSAIAWTIRKYIERNMQTKT